MEEKRTEIKKQIKHLHKEAIKNKALLSFKYDNMNRKISFIQVSVIVVSTIITFIESVKSQYDYESVGWDVIPIILASYIALIMAVLRFYKWEETKENISKCHDNHVFISNKLIKINNSIDKFSQLTGTRKEWENLVSTYETEIFVNYVTIKESFDSLMRYKDIIFYKNKFRKMFLKHEIINNDIDTVNRNKNQNLIVYRRTRWCPFKYSIKYDKFFREMAEQGFDEKIMDNDEEQEEFMRSALASPPLLSSRRKAETLPRQFRLISNPPYPPPPFKPPPASPAPTVSENNAKYKIYEYDDNYSTTTTHDSDSTNTKITEI